MAQKHDYRDLILRYARAEIDAPLPKLAKRPNWTNRAADDAWLERERQIKQLQALRRDRVVPVPAFDVLGFEPTDGQRMTYSRALRLGEDEGLWEVEAYGRSRAVRLL